MVMLLRAASALGLRSRVLAASAVGGGAALWSCSQPSYPVQCTSVSQSTPVAGRSFTEQSFRLDGRVALVTGGSRGIGFAIARGLSDQGAHVVITGRDERTLAHARRALLDLNPAAAVSTLAFDVGDPAACVEAVPRVVALAGRAPDILVNNAGINHRVPLGEFETGHFERVLRANLTGPFVLSRECSAAMVQNGWGRIINVGSIMGTVGRECLHAYVASKHAIAGLTKCTPPRRLRASCSSERLAYSVAASRLACAPDQRRPARSTRRRAGTARRHRQLLAAGVHRHGAHRTPPRRPRLVRIRGGDRRPDACSPVGRCVRDGWRRRLPRL